VASKIGLMVADSLLLATAIFSTIGNEALASRLGPVACYLLIVGIVLLLVLSIRRSPKGMDEDKS